MSAYPQLRVEIAFSTPPFSATPAWTDVSQYVRSVAIRRGRQRELDRVESGTATIELDNRDRRFDPSYAGSPYAPNVIPVRRVRVGAVWQTTTYWLYTGFVEAWAQRWPAWGDAVCAVQCSDLLALLALFGIQNTAMPQEYSGARIGRILDIAGWPSADRDLDTGQSQVQAETVTATALEHLERVVNAERGVFFVAGDGRAAFRNRHARILPRTAQPPIFGDIPGELPYRDIEIEYTSDQVWNQALVQRAGAQVPAFAENTESKQTYLARRLSVLDVPIVSDAEAQAAAEYLVSLYAKPQLLIRSFRVDPAADPANLWPVCLGLELSSRVTVRRRPPGGGTPVEQESFVEGIAWDIEPGHWQVTYWLSQADLQKYWIIAGTDTDQYAEHARLEQTTRLAY